ncbi:MAG TPA: glycosyltransferase family 1 protein [Nitrospirae bacterium]|nr:glycosyltransferase family 1 protein [Nitrospirota bacterium]HDZ02013.1 glycosyltransferase family 1 protein [Nitrospirota bacterium]
MKILHVHDHYRPCGGAEVYFMDILDSLEKKGHENVVLYSALNESEENGGTRKEYFVPPSPGLRRGFSLFGRIRKIVSHEKPDVIHIHGFHGNTSPFVVRILRKMGPSVHTAHDVLAFCLNHKKIHGNEESTCTRPVGWGCLTSGCVRPSREMDMRFIIKSAIVQHIEMLQYRRFNKIIVASDYMKKEMIRNGISPDRVECLYYFLNVENDWASRVGEIGKDNTILYVGRIEKNKGVVEFIEILSMIRDVSWKAKIIGYGNAGDEVRNKIKVMGLSEKIDMLGHVTHGELSQHYIASSLVAVPSCYPEPFGLVGLEAMYFGRPVVAFNVGGIGEWLKDKQTGFLVEFPDRKLFAEKIECLLRDKSLSEKFGKNGQEEVKRFLSKEDHINCLLHIYQGVINNWKTRR